jgi:hypothetical protein
MFAKNRTLLLLVILGIVVGLYFLLGQWGDQESNFRTSLPGYDTAVVDRVELSPANPDYPFDLVRDGNEWQVMVGDQSYAADPSSIRNLLDGLNGIPIRNVVANSSDRWEEYKVNEESGTRLKFISGNKPVSDLYLGRFEYIQPKSRQRDQFGRSPQGEMLSFVRMADEESVYAIDGMVSLGIRKNANEYRDKRLVKLGTESITSIEFKAGPDVPFTLSKEQEAWRIDGEIADTAKTVQFVRTLSNLRGKVFTDEDPDNHPVYGEVIITPVSGAPVILRAYRLDSLNYLVNSTANPSGVFKEDAAFLDKTFAGKDYFIRGE